MVSTIDVDKDSYWDAVGEGTVLVDVWSDSCQPCLVLGPHLERIAEEHDDLTLAKLDAVKARRLLMGLRVRGLPTLLLYRDGDEVARITANDLSPDRARAWLDEHLATPANEPGQEESP